MKRREGHLRRLVRCYEAVRLRSCLPQRSPVLHVSSTKPDSPAFPVHVAVSNGCSFLRHARRVGTRSIITFPDAPPFSSPPHPGHSVHVLPRHLSSGVPRNWWTVFQPRGGADGCPRRQRFDAFAASTKSSRRTAASIACTPCVVCSGSPKRILRLACAAGVRPCPRGRPTASFDSRVLHGEPRHLRCPASLPGPSRGRRRVQ